MPVLFFQQLFNLTDISQKIFLDFIKTLITEIMLQLTRILSGHLRIHPKTLQQTAKYLSLIHIFTTGDLYDHHDADGFITLFGLPLKVRAMMLKEVEQNKK